MWNGVHTIIIDEISIMSYQILKSIHSRLCEIYGNDEMFERHWWFERQCSG